MATKKKVYATHVTTPAGKRIYVKGKDKADLERKVLEVKLAMNAGVDITCDQTFREYSEMWLRVYKKPPKVRESSFITYKNNLDKHLIPFFGDMKLRDIKPLHVQMFLGSLSGLSKSVQTKCLQMLRAILRSAVDNGLIAKSPTEPQGKARRRNSPSPMSRRVSFSRRCPARGRTPSVFSHSPPVCVAARYWALCGRT